MARYFIYGIWILLVLSYVGIALFEWLERITGKRKNDDYIDYIKTAVFVSVAALVAYFIDQYYIEDIAAMVGFGLPPVFFQIFLLPLILFVMALIIGPSRDILIKRKK